MQRVQAAVPGAAQAPVGQQAPAPVLLLVPLPHCSGTVVPSVGQRLPAGQGWQEALELPPMAAV